MAEAPDDAAGDKPEHPAGPVLAQMELDARGWKSDIGEGSGQTACLLHCQRTGALEQPGWDASVLAESRPNGTYLNAQAVLICMMNKPSIVVSLGHAYQLANLHAIYYFVDNLLASHKRAAEFTCTYNKHSLQLVHVASGDKRTCIAAGTVPPCPQQCAGCPRSPDLRADIRAMVRRDYEARK